MTNPAAWIGFECGTDRGVIGRPVHTWAASTVVEEIAADADWQAWWLVAPRRRLDLLPCYTLTELGPPQVLTGRRAIRVQWRADGAVLADGDRTRLARQAVADLCTMLTVVQIELQLPPLPPLPPPPLVPPHLADSTADDVPPDPHVLARQIAEHAGVSVEFAWKMLGLPPG